MEMTVTDVQRLWGNACAFLKSKSTSLYETFFKGVAALSLEKGELLLGISSEFLADWILDNEEASEQLQEAITYAFGESFRFRFEIGYVAGEDATAGVDSLYDQSLPLVEETPAAVAEESPIAPMASTDGELAGLTRVTAEKCLPENTFENFVVGEENRYAYTAATTAVKSPGMWNPLYIYGGSGMGKTHLIQAVANEMVSQNRKAVIRYVTCEEFLNEYVASLRSKTDFKFRERFRNVDLLLIDDVHFLSGNKTQLQEEFFNTFNSLHNAGKQIILTSDKQPSDIPGLEKRLVSRFQSGMTMQITESTFETRLAILRQVQDSMTCKFPDAVLNFLAARITSNIRPLKSALIRLSVFAAAGMEITVDRAGELLGDLLDKEAEEKNNRLSIHQIQKAVAEYFDLQVRDLTGKARPQKIAEARMIAMYLCRKLTDNTQQDIGAAFGGRTHSTVLHAINQIEQDSHTNEDLKHKISNLQRRLQYS